MKSKAQRTSFPVAVLMGGRVRGSSTHFARVVARVRRGIEALFNSRFSARDRMKVTSFVFIDAATMAQLNQRFRQKRGPTDVLSFAPTEPESWGEVVICLDVVRRQAKEQGWSLDDELAFVAAHGWLHLLGWDHERSDQEEREMSVLQDFIYAVAVDSTAKMGQQSRR